MFNVVIIIVKQNKVLITIYLTKSFVLEYNNCVKYISLSLFSLYMSGKHDRIYMIFIAHVETFIRILLLSLEYEF